MALTPEDVIKKSFSATHLRRGYDETQVDDFLDEVVVELRRLLAENDSLRTDLEDCRASRGMGGDDTERFTPAAAVPGMGSGASDERAEQLQVELEEARRELAACQEARAQAEERAQAAEGSRVEGAEGASAEVEDLRGRVAASDQRVRELEGQLSEAQDRARAAEEQAEQARGEAEQARGEAEERAAEQGQVAPVAAAAAMPGAGEESSKIISLAQRLHDQHVAEGETTKRQLIEEAEGYRDRTVAEADQRRDELVTTGQETHDRLVHEGQTRHDELVSTGQETHDRLVQEGKTKHDELVSTGQETHDRLVDEGRQQREQLVTEGQSRHDELVTTGQQTHDRLVDEGQTSRDQMVGEAEQKRSSILEDLGTQQASLTGRIGELQTQETDLRDRLRTFLSEQLSRVDGDQQR